MRIKFFACAVVVFSLLGFKYKDGLTSMGLKFVAPAVIDKATIYAPEVGEIIYETNGGKFYGRDDASNWVELSGVEPTPSPVPLLPAGVILPFGGTTIPDGYVLCDGAAVSRTVYSTLFAAIGTSFGAGDGATTFNLPDLRGRFLRGVAGSSSLDPDKTARTSMNSGGATGNNVGSVQGDQFASHSHGFSATPNGPLGAPGDYITKSSNATGAYAGAVASSGGAETRPVNAYVNYIIKY